MHLSQLFIDFPFFLLDISFPRLAGPGFLFFQFNPEPRLIDRQPFLLGELCRKVERKPKGIVEPKEGFAGEDF